MKPAGNPIHVALVTSAYPVGRQEVAGGVEGVCYYLAGALARITDLRLHLFVAFAERYGFDHYSRLEDNGLTIHAVPSRLRRSPFLSYLGYLLFDSQAALRHAPGTQFDLVHFQNDAPWAARSPMPAVLTVHGLNERDTLFRGSRMTRRLRSWGNSLLHGRMRRRVRNIIAISPYVRQVLNPSAAQRVWDIENPVADSFFQVVRKPVAGRVLFAGRISPLKNVAGLVEGFALATESVPGCELRLAGMEPDRTYATLCRDVANRLGIAERVKFLGPLSINQLQAELAQASLLALCSFQENAPLVISEAMAAGVPVIASDVGGVPWLVEEGATGYLVNPAMPGDITRGIRRALNNQELDKMGYRARATAERRFRASVVAQKTVEVYRKVLRDNGTAE